MELPRMFVGEVPDPPRGEWRQITEKCDWRTVGVWQEHLDKVGLSETMVDPVDDGFILYARRK